MLKYYIQFRLILTVYLCLESTSGQAVLNVGLTDETPPHSTVMISVTLVISLLTPCYPHSHLLTILLTHMKLMRQENSM